MKGLEFKKDNFLSFDKISVFTQNNDFQVSNERKISIKGNKFDGREVLGLPAEGMKKYYENE